MKPNSNIPDPGRRVCSKTSARAFACLVACVSLLAVGPAVAIMQTDGGPFASRVTSTATLTASELAAYELQGRFRGFLGTPIFSNFFLIFNLIGKHKLFILLSSLGISVELLSSFEDGLELSSSVSILEFGSKLLKSTCWFIREVRADPHESFITVGHWFQLA